ncbi:hypothetical protein RCL1_004366 [Eukaryota sp. TZLM3-RCL]
MNSSVKAPNVECTIKQLEILHPHEDLFDFGRIDRSYWLEKTLTDSEIEVCLSWCSSSSSGCPSGLSFDYLKKACKRKAEIKSSIAAFYKKVLAGTLVFPAKLLASRLIALLKLNGKVRPIAVGQSFARLFSALVFRRLKAQSALFLVPHQFGISFVDGTAVCAKFAEIFLTQDFHNVLCVFDFSNAFNTVLRKSILLSLLELKLYEFIPVFHALLLIPR